MSGGSGGRRHHRANEATGRVGGGRVVVVAPCYQSKGTLKVVVHGLSAVAIRAPDGGLAPIEQVVNRDTDRDGQDGRGPRVQLDVRATRALLNANLKLTHSGDAPEKRGAYAGQVQGVAFRVEPGRWTVRAKAGALEAEKEVVVGAGGEKTVHIWLGAVFATATFTQRSSRTLPDQEGWTLAQPNATPKVYTRRFALTEGDGDAFDTALLVDLGLGGGDKCEVGVGLNAACDAQRREFVNWREIGYEILAPKADGDDRLSHTLAPYFEDDGGPQFSADVRGRLRAVLAPLFIRLQRFAGVFYTADNVTAAGGANVVVRSEYFTGTQADRRVTVLSDARASALLTRLRSHDPANGKTRMTMLFCDYLTNRPFQSNLERTLTDVVGPKAVPLDGVTGVLPMRLDVAGASAVTEFQWKVTGCFWRNAWVEEFELAQGTRVRPVGDDLADADPSHVVVEPGQFRVTFPVLPANGIVKELPEHRAIVIRNNQLYFCYQVNDAFDLRDVPQDMEALREAFAVEPRDVQEFALIPVRLELTVSLERRRFDFNAQAARGTATFALGDPDRGPAGWQGLTRTLLHELGHCMGQVYGSVADMRVWGRGDGTVIPGVAFPPVVPNGAAYQDHDHNGPHCAHHLTPEERREDHYQPYSVRADKCIMWGEGDLRAASNEVYCPACSKHILAEDLRDITKKWGPNMPG
jgi:hypothetical protein